MPTLSLQGGLMDITTKRKLEQVLEAIQSTSSYDYVLVDSASVSRSSETAMLASIICNVLLVVCPGQSLRRSVNNSLSELAQHHANLIGLVINDLTTKSEYSYFGKVEQNK
jgi:Mrp family chromosome partitioning ATPase